MLTFQHDEENAVSLDRVDRTTQSDELINSQSEASLPFVIQKVSALHGRYGNSVVQRILSGNNSRKSPLPQTLKAGIEALSKLSLDNVTVHYDSEKPAQIGALAFAQGSDIHLGPGQEQHLPHETWHVVQQAQGRVRPTMKITDSISVNDDQGLENEADMMGAKALAYAEIASSKSSDQLQASVQSRAADPIQCISAFKVKMGLQSDETYWPLYTKWFAIVGLEKVNEILEPLENVDAVKIMLDAFFSTEKTDYSEAELKKIELERKYGSSDVYKALIAGINTSSSHKSQLEQLLANFKEHGPTYFEYTMGSTDKTKFLTGTKEGDCNTVVHTFQLLAEDYLGITVTYKTSSDVGFTGRFIAPKTTTIDGKTGNVDGSEFWLFDNHYWIEAENQKFDVLFGKIGVDPDLWIKETGTSDNPSLFGSMRKIWTTGKVSPISERYTTQEPINKK